MQRFGLILNMIGRSVGVIVQFLGWLFECVNEIKFD